MATVTLHNIELVNEIRTAHPNERSSNDRLGSVTCRLACQVDPSLKIKARNVADPNFKDGDPSYGPFKKPRGGSVFEVQEDLVETIRAKCRLWATARKNKK